MKKLYTLLLIAVVIAFGLVFAAIDNSSPPRAEKANVKSEMIQTAETAQTVQADFDVGVSDLQTRATNHTATEASFTGDIPIIVRDSSKSLPRTDERLSNSNQPQIVPMLTATNHLKITNWTNNTNKFVSNFAVFRGFGAENQPRGKIWV